MNNRKNDGFLRLKIFTIVKITSTDKEIRYGVKYDRGPCARVTQFSVAKEYLQKYHVWTKLHDETDSKSTWPDVWESDNLLILLIVFIVGFFIIGVFMSASTTASRWHSVVDAPPSHHLVLAMVYHKEACQRCLSVNTLPELLTELPKP